MEASVINAFFATPLGLAVFAVSFVPLWCASCFYVSYVSGWFSLSQRFRMQSEPGGEVKTRRPAFQSIFTRFWSQYGSVIQLTAAQDALYASVFFLFCVGHPPLRIPWDEIRFKRRRCLSVNLVQLTLGNQEKSPCASPLARRATSASSIACLTGCNFRDRS